MIQGHAPREEWSSSVKPFQFSIQWESAHPGSARAMAGEQQCRRAGLLRASIAGEKRVARESPLVAQAVDDRQEALGSLERLTLVSDQLGAISAARVEPTPRHVGHPRRRILLTENLEVGQLE